MFFSCVCCWWLGCVGGRVVGGAVVVLAVLASLLLVAAWLGLPRVAKPPPAHGHWLRAMLSAYARLLRELDTLIPAGSAPAAGLPESSPAVQLDDGLDRLSLKELKELARQRRIKGISKLKKDELIAHLRGGASAGPAALPG